MLLWILFVLLWLPIKILFPLKIVGKKNLVKKGGVVYVCNHFSNLDVVLIQLSLGRRMKFMAKKELFSNKCKARFFRSIGAFPIDRQAKADIGATKCALNVLKSGKPLFMFPEGTRNKTNTDELQEIKGGAIVFASKTGVPLVPMMLSRKPKAFRRTTLVVGEPMDFGFEDKTRPSKDELEVATEKLAKTMVDLQLLGKKK